MWEYGNMEIWIYGNNDNNNVANVTESSSQLEIFKEFENIEFGKALT